MVIRTKKNVLIVDDSPFIREMVGKIIERLGHLVSKAGDGVEGIAIASNQEIDVIILDVQMPNKDGLQTLKELRADPHHAQTPIIMLTSVGDGDIVKRSILGKATHYLLKDDPMEIMKRLKEVFATL
jgi:two-component system chemotaxis response regulator CheY